MMRALPSGLRVLAAAAALLPAAGGAAAAPVGQPRFAIQPPGKVAAGQGTENYVLYAPGMLFPIPKEFPATLNSQVHRPGGRQGGDQCAAVNYDEQWQDTLCEERGRKRVVPLGCPTDRVHQGIDLRGGSPATCRRIKANERKVVPVVAVTDGEIAGIGSYSVTLRTGDGQKFVYLHLDMQNLAVRRGRGVSKGDLIGYMDNDFGGTPTTFHLHIEHWMNIAGKGFVPVPMYCDLAVAYKALHGKDYDVIGGSQRCDGTAPSAPSQPEPPLSGDRLVSFWDHDGSEMGLLAEGDRRTIIYTRPRPDLEKLVSPGEIFFIGRKRGDAYQGEARVFASGCAPAAFAVEGPVLDNGRRIEVKGAAPQRRGGCAVTGNRPERLVFTFLRQKGEAPAQICAADELPRQSLTEKTRNWGAITMYVPFEQWLSYLRNWPGLRLDGDGQPVNLGLDSRGGFIPALETDESGVGLWWYWLLVRKGYGPGGEPARQATLREIARGIAGNDAPAAALAAYTEAYQRLAPRYFSRDVGLDDGLDLADAPERWSLAQVMFHHEAGRPPLISRTTFDRGIRFGTEYMRGAFRGVNAYLPPCEAGGPAVAGTSGGPPEADPAARIAVLERQLAEMEAGNARTARANEQLNELVADLRARLDSILEIAAR